MQAIITEKSTWLDMGNNQVYTVICVANEGADEDRKEEYPVLVVYQGPDGRIWTKSVERFLAKKIPHIVAPPRPMPDIQYALALLSAAVKNGNEGAILLATILGNVQACSTCGYVWYSCRCPKEEKE